MGCTGAPNSVKPGGQNILGWTLHTCLEELQEVGLQKMRVYSRQLDSSTPSFTPITAQKAMEVMTGCSKGSAIAPDLNIVTALNSHISLLRAE